MGGCSHAFSLVALSKKKNKKKNLPFHAGYAAL